MKIRTISERRFEKLFEDIYGQEEIIKQDIAACKEYIEHIKSELDEPNTNKDSSDVEARDKIKSNQEKLYLFEKINSKMSKCNEDLNELRKDVKIKRAQYYKKPVYKRAFIFNNKFEKDCRDRLQKIRNNYTEISNPLRREKVANTLHKIEKEETSKGKPSKNAAISKQLIQERLVKYIDSEADSTLYFNKCHEAIHGVPFKENIHWLMQNFPKPPGEEIWVKNKKATHENIVSRPRTASLPHIEGLKEGIIFTYDKHKVQCTYDNKGNITTTKVMPKIDAPKGYRDSNPSKSHASKGTSQ